jgi:hypothetical protein
MLASLKNYLGRLRPHLPELPMSLVVATAAFAFVYVFGGPWGVVGLLLAAAIVGVSVAFMELLDDC